MKDPKPSNAYLIQKSDYDILKRAVQHDASVARILNQAHYGTFKEIITDDKMKQLFGANYSGLLYYDFDACEWNRSSWEGMDIDFQYIDEKHVYQLRQALSWMGKLNGLDLLAPVVMPVDNKFYPGRGQYIEKPIYQKYSDSLVGNFVCRSQKTGRILTPSKNWIGVDKFEDSYGLSQVGITRFAKNIYNDEWFRERAHALITQQR